MADVATDVDGEVTTDGARGGGKGVGGTEDGCRNKISGRCETLKTVHLLRPVLTASRPSQTMAQMGPDSMSTR